MKISNHNSRSCSRAGSLSSQAFASASLLKTFLIPRRISMLGSLSHSFTVHSTAAGLWFSFGYSALYSDTNTWTNDIFGWNTGTVLPCISGSLKSALLFHYVGIWPGTGRHDAPTATAQRLVTL